MLFIALFLAFSSSEINCEGGILTITNQDAITAEDVSECQSATKIVINGNSVQIEDSIFASFSKVTEIEITVSTITVGSESFKGLKELSSVKITTKYANFDEYCFAETIIQTFNLKSDEEYTEDTYTSSFAFYENSFAQCEIKEMRIGGQKLEFRQRSFSSAVINDFCIDALQTDFKRYSFEGTQFYGFHVCSPSISFGKFSFTHSFIQELKFDEKTVTNELVFNNVEIGKNAFESCEGLYTVSIKANHNVTILYNAFKDCTNLETVNIESKEYLYIGPGVFCECPSDIYQITGEDKSVDEESNDCVADPNPDPPDEDEDEDKEGGGLGSDSSGGDNDSGESARVLGNMNIETVYLGTSPNIYFNLNFFVSFMKTLRKKFGKIIPSPELIHSAIWVGEKNAKDDSKGAVFVYGKYENKNNNAAFLWKDGAKGYTLTLKEFKKRYQANEPMKLNIQRKMKVNEFIKEIGHNGKWGLDNYKWPTNNCQHFTSKLIDILEATRATPTNEDWYDLPKPILNSLKTNEQKDK